MQVTGDSVTAGGRPGRGTRRLPSSSSSVLAQTLSESAHSIPPSYSFIFHGVARSITESPTTAIRNIFFLSSGSSSTYDSVGFSKRSFPFLLDSFPCVPHSSGIIFAHPQLASINLSVLERGPSRQVVFSKLSCFLRKSPIFLSAEVIEL